MNEAAKKLTKKISGKGDCPICGKPIPPNVSMTCRECWWKIPANDRQALGGMVRHGHDIASKLASVVQRYRAKQSGAA